MSEQKIEFYKGPAGGWGALNSVKNTLLRQDIPLKGAKTLLSANQPDGFDCPGCAWPDRNHASTFEFCENGAKAVAAEATARRAGPELFARHTVAELAAQSDFWLEDQGRLTHPMVYDAASDRYVPIAWDDAFALVARHLNALPDPDQAIFYTSGRASNEAAFLYQLFVREYGTNNFPDCSNMCHEPSGSAMRPQIGVGKGTVTLQDFEQADAIFIFGQNPGTNHPRMLGELREAHKRGAQIVSFNPLRERGLERFADPQNKMEMATLGSTPISTHYFQVRVGGDLAVVKGMMKHLVEAEYREGGVLDHAFIREHTTGVEALLADLRAESWALIEQESGLSEAQIRAAAEVYRQARSVIACWGMGITQHMHSVATIQMIVNWLLLRGNIGRPGAGPCPVRGHSNVQGDRTMGIWEKPPAALLDRLQEVFGFEPPREPGVDTVEAIQAMLDGKARVFFALGGNFAAATPDTYETWKALQRCDLTVHVTTKLNRSHIVHGREALILPCLGRTEIDMQAAGPQGVTVEDSMSMVHISVGINPPASGHLLSEPAIVARLAAATLGARSRVPWLWMIEDYARIRDKIEQVFPDFKDFNRRIAVPGGFRLRNTASERIWNTGPHKAVFVAHPVPQDTPVHQARARTRDTVVFTLLTTRSHDQYNTTIYGHDDRYRGVYGQRRVVFIHPEDIRALGMKDGDWVDIQTVWSDGQERRADRFKLVGYDIPRGNLAAYYPETNPLVPLSSVALNAGTPTSKSIPVVLVPSAAGAAAAGPSAEVAPAAV
ncbi:FdhF/YdeP family oxidoreductase [Paracidovorax citrulli]|uniref:Oxidoreductase alpha (Molybdopterin) subunit n=2 Tax=Paracidovorax citrulli TaxID=80869 RepID=A1TTT4_PARC0|nr:FdhF/YdeP family oxidoreductase [Paracidovorax citrulli]ABM34372.1 oxidoreductase alpha (molybdopterin) subunit [Paracidovorax citrulli AAC00-1]ATG93843.1 CbbBc protein [Paracidovorax citrulli]PVY63813.1 molybdopterin-dependent oxidoreductase alpha subunit [Paracidovorax citrulli]REG67226.1 molybdopterin-dependent oxidoreductase alpha subunit [Paracidovorax citrulli]RLJ91786.1 molybdopterin-dependent oxidoreductase alpha subunit [Paracidovorax citrulli]